MQIEFDTNCNLFRDIPRYSVFVWNGNGKVYVKIDKICAINLENQATEFFDEKNEVIPCTISKIVLKK